MDTCGQIISTDSLYPAWLMTRQGDGPVLWYAGNPALLSYPAVAVTGVRDPTARIREQALTLGRTIARQGYGLISGCARGVDTLALEAAWEAGGWIIACPAGSLIREIAQDRARQQLASGRALFLSLYGKDEPFSPARAMLRNRLLMRLARLVVVTASHYREGGSYKGALEALKARKRWGVPLAALLDEIGFSEKQPEGQEAVFHATSLDEATRFGRERMDVLSSSVKDAANLTEPVPQTVFAARDCGPATGQKAASTGGCQPAYQSGQEPACHNVFAGNMALIRSGALHLSWPLPDDFVHTLSAWIEGAGKKWRSCMQPELW